MVVLKLLWFSFIAFMPMYFALIGSLVIFFEEKVLGKSFDE